jgi:hypothetical protein
MTYEALTLLGLGVRVRHQHDADTYNYTELCDFLKLLVVVGVHVRIRA